MTQSGEHQDDTVLAGEYALGLLNADQAAAFEARLTREPDLRATYARWADDFARMTDELPEVAPDPQIKAAINDQLFGTSKPAHQPGFGLRAILAGIATASLLAFIAFGFFSGGFDGKPDYLAQISAQDNSLQVLASFDVGNRQLSLHRTTGKPAPGRALELWLISGDAAPVSLGLLPADANGTLPIPADLVPLLPGAIMAISDEPASGSPTGAPTGDVLALGPITQA